MYSRQQQQHMRSTIDEHAAATLQQHRQLS
jgi:hypothetical protein